jgi:hypothetical protein
MANEAVLRDRLEDPIDFTVDNATGIEKGAVLALTDARTAILASTVQQPIAGIAAREKVASDGRTRLAVYRKGIFDMYCSGSIAVGAAVKVCDLVGTYPNYVETETSASACSGAVTIGHALETATNGEVAQIYINLH